MNHKTTTEKLENLERYIRRINFSYASAKKNLLFHLHDLFQEEMKETASGKKWESKLDTQETRDTSVAKNKAKVEK